MGKVPLKKNFITQMTGSDCRVEERKKGKGRGWETRGSFVLYLPCTFGFHHFLISQRTLLVPPLY